MIYYDNADIVSADDRFKFIDDLSVLTLISLSGLLVEYDIHSHVPSDIGTEEKNFTSRELPSPKHPKSYC